MCVGAAQKHIDTTARFTLAFRVFSMPGFAVITCSPATARSAGSQLPCRTFQGVAATVHRERRPLIGMYIHPKACQLLGLTIAKSTVQAWTTKDTLLKFLECKSLSIQANA